MVHDRLLLQLLLIRNTLFCGSDGIEMGPFFIREPSHLLFVGTLGRLLGLMSRCLLGLCVLQNSFEHRNRIPALGVLVLLELRIWGCRVLLLPTLGGQGSVVFLMFLDQFR